MTWKGVKFGNSPINHSEVVVDPYAQSTSRLIVLLLLAFFSFLFAARLYIVYAVSANPNGTSAATSLTFPQRRILCVLSICSIFCSAIHFIDNFARTPEYFTTPFIYNGWLYPLDFAFYYWFLSAALLSHAGETLLNHKFSESFTRHAAFYAIYAHCVMIWTSPIGHYYIEPMQSYSTIANASIWAEASFALLLNGYAVYLACSGQRSGSGKGEYSRINNEIDLELSEHQPKKQVIEDEEEGEEGQFEQVRRRSRDASPLRS